MGDAIVLQAGDAPEPGDVNRLDVPMSYRRADQMVRPVRARAGNFSMPWDERTTEEWLTRFELIV